MGVEGDLNLEGFRKNHRKIIVDGEPLTVGEFLQIEEESIFCNWDLNGELHQSPSDALLGTPIGLIRYNGETSLLWDKDKEFRKCSPTVQRFYPSASSPLLPVFSDSDFQRFDSHETQIRLLENQIIDERSVLDRMRERVHSLFPWNRINPLEVAKQENRVKELDKMVKEERKCQKEKAEAHVKWRNECELAQKKIHEFNVRIQEFTESLEKYMEGLKLPVFQLEGCVR